MFDSEHKKQFVICNPESLNSVPGILNSMYMLFSSLRKAFTWDLSYTSFFLNLLNFLNLHFND